MKTLLIILAFISTISNYAQVDTIYFNFANQESTKEKADFFQIRTNDSIADVYQIDEYSMDNKMTRSYEVSDFTHRKRIGFYREYFQNGSLKYDMEYSSDAKLDGKVNGYFENGNPRRIDIYKNGEFVEGKCFTENGNDTTHYLYYVAPSYKNGGLKSFSKFLSQNLTYPSKPYKKGIEDRVYVNFIIEKNGQITGVNTIKKGNKHLDKEAMRVVKKSSGNWIPVFFEGVPTRSRFTVPVNFKLE